MEQGGVRMEAGGMSSHASDFDSISLGQQGVCL
jgi:hypothetical protein